MKILISSFTFPPNKDGVSEAASMMSVAFLQRGWQVDVATMPVNPARETMDWNGAAIHEFSVTGNGQPKRPFCGEVEQYRQFLIQGTWDVIIFHAYTWSVLVAIDLLDRISGKKVLVSHGYAALQWTRVANFPWGLGVWAWSVRDALKMVLWIRKIDQTVYLSERADLRGFFDHWIAKATGYKGRRVIPNGVDPNERGTDAIGFRQAHGIPVNHFMFLCVANYSRRKDQGYAARAFRAAKLTDAVLVFIGSEFNSDSARFQAEDEVLPDTAKHGRVIWLENIDRPSTLNAFAACDAFVLSADHEAQPIALLEAMREEKPWVARDAGCISQMAGGICVRSESDMGSQMARLTTNPKLCETLGQEGQNAIRTSYNHQQYIESYCTLIQELTGQSSPP
jgi:glycosyltransferase involved in cell wall biosynthesis